MLKKISFSLCFMFAGVSSLFALDKGSIVLYPQAGFGISSASGSGISGSQLSAELNSIYGVSSYDYKDAKSKPGFSCSAGIEADYMITDFLALTGGILIDYMSFKVVYESSSNPDAGMKFKFLYAGVPVGLRFYRGIFMAGCGLYMSAPLYNRASVKYGPYSRKEKLDNAYATAGFFADAGLNFNTSDKNNLLVFLRVKRDYTYSYYEDYRTIRDTKNWSCHLTAAYGFRLD